ncbi:MAG: hypothetical protein CL868_16420 [Cytophagaceae bacterium]|nr:hypothetical protein [Cytophagaceae bacterium]|tara:strand:+ start:709 stop:1146 length:438 start_codon:yes stop_codon:yes gene_type:complete
MQNRFVPSMEKTFKKYFLCFVLILLGGLIQMHANNIARNQVNSIDIEQAGTHLDCGQFQYNPLSGHFLKKVTLSDLTENEEQEEIADNGKSNDNLRTGSISTAFFYVLAWQSTLDCENTSRASHSRSYPLTYSCKRYIQFEVFRI